jgi:hypothetical protein
MRSPLLRTARVGDHLPPSVVDRSKPRRLEATAIIVPGLGDAGAYVDALASRAADFAAWDGRVVVAEPDGEATHRLLIVDRYAQVYAVHDEGDVRALPTPHDLEEWFRFLSTACPECGVLDEALLSGPTL